MTRPLPTFTFLALLFFVCGCASAEGRYGKQARYAPALRGYVLAADISSDDPPPEAEVIVLTDPLTGEKLRCREEVVRWIFPHQDAAEDAISDENWELATAIAMSPLLGAGIYLAAPGLLVIGAAMAPADLATSTDARALFERGEELFERERWTEVTIMIERAIVKMPALARYERALFYLGIAHAKLGNDREAKRSLRAFIDRALVRDVNAYRTAENWLATLGDPVSDRCDSRDPLRLKWSRT